MQPSTPALGAVSRALTEKRDVLVGQWADWVLERLGSSTDSQRGEIERQLGLLVDITVEMAGPLRRHATELWHSACEWHGRASANRGLAAGEIVEELQYLRELLIRHLSEATTAMPARQAMATVLRLNRVLDKGIAHAVVGYTDALIETLFNQSGVPVSNGGQTDNSDSDKRLAQFEKELSQLRERSNGF